MNSDVKLVYLTASTYGTDTCLCGTNVVVSEKKEKKEKKNEKVADFCNSGERYAHVQETFCFGIRHRVTG